MCILVTYCVYTSDILCVCICTYVCTNDSGLLHTDPQGYIHLPIYLHLPEGQVGGNHGDEVWHSLADTLKGLWLPYLEDLLINLPFLHISVLHKLIL